MKSLEEIIKKTPLYSLLRKTSLYSFIRSFLRKQIEGSFQNKIISTWEAKGKPVPPPALYKRLVIKDYAQKHGIGVFIETGTHLGDTIAYLKPVFKQLISIELDTTLYKNAQKRFAKDKNINLYQGDSAEMMEVIMSKVTEPCLFWLDGHYSGGETAMGTLSTPILAELNCILNHPNDGHIILIDDARTFTGQGDYPSLEYLQDFIEKKNMQLKFSVIDDIIRIHK